MGFITKTLLAGLVTAVSVRGQCVGPDINDASLSLIPEFEGFREDVCKSPTSWLLRDSPLTSQTSTRLATLPLGTVTCASKLAAPRFLTRSP